MLNIISNLKYFIKQNILNIRRIIKYIPLIWKDRDWDYGFLLELEKAKLTNMLEYFKTSDIIIEDDKKEIIKYIKLSIKLLDIVMTEANEYLELVASGKFETDNSTGYTTLIEPNVWKFHKYVNLKNANRFVNKEKIEFLKNNELLKADVYQEKAHYLLYKIRLYKEYTWWD